MDVGEDTTLGDGGAAEQLFSFSSLRTASWMWRGMMRLRELSRAALPANSRISAHRYSRTAPM